MIGGVPWKMNAKDDKADGEEMKGDEIGAEEPMEKPTSAIKDSEKVMKMKKRREDVW